MNTPGVTPAEFLKRSYLLVLSDLVINDIQYYENERLFFVKWPKEGFIQLVRTNGEEVVLDIDKDLAKHILNGYFSMEDEPKIYLSSDKAGKTTVSWKPDTVRFWVPETEIQTDSTKE